MDRVRALLATVVILGTAARGHAIDHPLQISWDRQNIVDASGENVFFMADAPWHLVMELSREQAIQYLDHRSANGFNALLVMLMVPAGYTGSSANHYGEEPFLQPGDFSTPNEAYFSHVDWILDRAEERGITLFMTPAYLGFDCGSEGWCDEIQQQGVEAMRDWGRWVGLRYRNQPNIVWVQGGDTDAESYGMAAHVDAIAEGILEVDPNHLHTAHCARYSSAVDCYDRPWLHFNTTYADCQTAASELYIDHHRPQSRPYVFIEGRYELEYDWSPQCMRGQAYASLLGGAVGHFYGHRDIWRFSPGWEQALDTPGVSGLTRFDRLLRSRSWHTLHPDYGQLVLKLGFGQIDGGDYASSARTMNGNSFIAYLPTQREITVNMLAISGHTAEAWWFDPSTGEGVFDGYYPTQGDRVFESPSQRDWVLVIDDVDANLPNVWESATPVAEPSLRLHLAMPSPNPFNPRTTISFAAPLDSEVKVEAFDVRGRFVDVLFEGRGEGVLQSFIWDAGDQASGVYFLRLSANGETRTQKIALVQ